jgi:gas vesicle protein
MSDRDPIVIVEKGNNSGMGAFVIGALLGAGAALLLAPKSGKETQDELKEQVHKWKGVAEERMKEAQEVVEEHIDQARVGVSSKMEDVRGAVEAGRQAAVEAREDLEHKLEKSKSAYRAGVDAARTAARETDTPSIES